MFWVMMYMILFGGSVVPELTFAPAESVIVETVSDQERLPVILSIRAEMASQEEELLAFMKQRYEELGLLSRDHGSSNSGFRAVFERIDRERHKTQSALIENRFRMKAQMTREEWKAVFKKK